MRKYVILIVLVVLAVMVAGCGTSPATSAGGGTVSGGGVAYAQGLYQSTQYPAGLTVNGTGTVQASPDIVYVTLGVDLKEQEPSSVVANAGTAMEQILSALKGAGIAEEDIHTASYNLWVEQRYDPQTGQPTGVIDYHIIHTVRFAVRDLSKVGTVLSAAVSAGANTVNEVSFTVSNQDELAKQARAKALADAQARAQEMAGTLNLSLGKIVSVMETSGYSPVPVYYDARGGAAMDASVPMPAGSFSVTINVTVVYALP